MANDPKLEAYLSSLDRALGQISVGDRSDIITEIKSHILEARERDPSQEISQLLAALGEPENVANRYLLERGIRPGKPSKSPIVKWLTIGFLGTFAIMALSVLALIWSFTPLLKVDEESGRVTILGGLIDVNESEGRIKIGGSQFHSDPKRNVMEGEVPLDSKKIDLIQIPFQQGKLDILPSPDQKFRWSCRAGKLEENSSVTEANRVFTLNLGASNGVGGGVNCDLQIPMGIKTKIEGLNGKIDLSHPQGDFEVLLKNGKVEIHPDPKQTYAFDAQVKVGQVGEYSPPTSQRVAQKQKAISILVRVDNGKIDFE